jgi:HNH endonuclease
MKSTISCKYCKKEFIGSICPTRADIYCNRKCMAINFLKPKRIQLCITCNNEFSRLKKGKFCSIKCIRYSGNKESLKHRLGKGFWKNATYEQKLERYKQLYESKVIKQDGCWGWNSFLDNTGSGKVGSRGYIISAYRLNWILYNGPIPEGKLVLHKCHNRACSRIEHLYIGTNKDNTRDMLEAGRGNFCKQNSKNAKLDKDKVMIIKQMLKDKVSQHNIAKEFNVSRGSIQDIHRNKSWKDI